MKHVQRYSLFWIAVCLPSLLAAQTNTLLAVHIADCCEHQCPDESPPTPADHQKNCPYCQFFLNAADKTIIESPTFSLHAETDVHEETAVIQSHTHQNDIACPPGRGPPRT